MEMMSGMKEKLVYKSNFFTNHKDAVHIEDDYVQKMIDENVDRLLKSPAKQRGRDFGMILRSFYENGYDVEWRVINAGEYGLPQKRERWYCVAFRSDVNFEWPKPVGGHPTLRDIVGVIV